LTYGSGVLNAASGYSIGTTGVSILQNTVSNVGLIQFMTGSNSAPVTGALGYDTALDALSYWTDTNNPVQVNIGQQSYIRVYNATGATIVQGTALSLQGATGSYPEVSLPVASVDPSQVAGLAATNIGPNQTGFIISYGILTNLSTVSYSVGDILYLSDTVPGGLINTASSLALSSRTNQIGYVLQAGTTAGQIFVSVRNENTSLIITDKERDVTTGNLVSAGAYSFGGISVGSTNTTFNVGAMYGWIPTNTGATFSLNPDVTEVYYPGATGLTTPYLNTAISTFVLVGITGSMILLNTFPTPDQRRHNIYLGKIVHPNKTTIQNVLNTVDYETSPMSALRDMFTPLPLINQGITTYPNGATLSFNTTAGSLWGMGINYVNNQNNPNQVSIPAYNPVTFQYRTQIGGTFSNTTLIDPNNYDVGGTVTAVTGHNATTNQRIYVFPSGLVRIQYGQTVYGSLAAAIAGAQTESFVEYPNNAENGILIGILSVTRNITDLSNTSNAEFLSVSKFGDIIGAGSGSSTTTLQQAYNNSTNPEIVTSSPLGALTIQRGTTADTDNVLEIENGSGTITSYINGIGNISGNSIAVGGTGAAAPASLGNNIIGAYSTSSGNPVFLVNNNGALFYGSLTASGITASSYALLSLSASFGTGYFFDYWVSGVTSGSYRVGTVMAVTNGSAVQYTDTSTADLVASTAGINFSVGITGSNILLSALITSGSWNVKVGTRVI